MHLNFIANAWWRLGVLEVLHRILLMYVVLGASGSLRAWIRVDAADSLTRVLGVLIIRWT